MAMSHANCDHPATPAGRAKCRANGGPDGTVKGPQVDAPARTPATRTRGTKTAPKTSTRNLKRPGTQLRTIGDLPDVPRMLAHGCRIAWDKGWPVTVGEQFNDTEARIVVRGDLGEIALVWKVSLPHGVWGIFFRPDGSSVTHKLTTVDQAFRIASEDTDEWLP